MPHSVRSQRSPRRRPAPKSDGLVGWVTLGTLAGGIAGWVVATGAGPWGNPLVTPLRLAPSADTPANLTGPGPTIELETGAGAVVVPAPQVPDSPTPSHLIPTREPLAFADVPAEYWAKPYIDALTARKVLSGLPDGTFAPDRPLSRAELAAQIANAFSITARTAPKSFTDVPPDDWAADPIQQAVAMGFMTGYPDGEFRPAETVTRLQVLVALAAGLSLPETTASQQQLQSYADWQAIPPWGRQQVGAAMQAGIIRPQGEAEPNLRPNEPATRAEVATLIYAALAYLGSVEAIGQ